MSFAQKIVVFAGLVGQKTELCGKSVKEGFKIGKHSGLDIAGFRSYIPTHQRMSAVIERHFQRSYHVEHHAVGMTDMTSGKRRLYAAGCRPVAQMFRRIIEFRQRSHNGFVIVNGWRCCCIEINFAESLQISCAVFALIVTGVDVRVADGEHFCHFQENIGHVIDGIFPFRRYTAKGNGLIG